MKETSRRKFGQFAVLATLAATPISIPEQMSAAATGGVDQKTLPLPVPATHHQVNLDGVTQTNGMLLPQGNVTVQGNGWDSGIAVKSGANNTALFNGMPFQAGLGKPPAQHTNFLLRDFRVQGNRGDGTHGNSTSGNPRLAVPSKDWIFGIHLADLKHVLLDHLWIDDAPTYAVTLDNVSDAIIQNCRMESPSGALNTDGIHINGPASDIGIHNCDILSPGDDSIALNAPEGYGGDIRRVTISDCRFHTGLTAMRIYTFISNTPCYVSDVVFSNCIGKFANRNEQPCAVFRLGNMPRSDAPNLIQSLSVSNCFFSTETYFVQAVDNIGTLKLSNVTWDSPTSTKYGFICLELSAISEISVTSCSIYRTSAGNAAPSLINSRDPAGASVGKLVINGFSISSQSHSSPSPAPYLIDMTNLTIGQLVIEALDTTDIASLVNPVSGFKGIGIISGAGVLATGFQIPDSVMANGVPYLSATSPNEGKPCIKISGKVMAFSFA